MRTPMDSCPHDRVVRLEVASVNYWICTWCNCQFVPKGAVDWKIAHLTTELGKRMLDESSS